MYLSYLSNPIRTHICIHINTTHVYTYLHPSPFMYSIYDNDIEQEQEDEQEHEQQNEQEQHINHKEPSITRGDRIDPLTSAWAPPEQDQKQHIKSEQALYSTQGVKMSLIQEARYLILHEERFKRFGRVAEIFALSQISRTVDEQLSFIKRQEVQYHYNTAREGVIAAAVADKIKNLETVITNEHHIKHHQKHIHVTAGDVTDEFEGHTFLPSSVTGSSRHQSQLFNDALFTAAQDGEPSAMLTMSANPNWPEIQAELFKREGHKGSDQKSSDRTDIISQVFHGKLQALLKDLRDGTAFGGKKTAYIIHVIEFQWRK